jgi:hypothetical protein
VAATLPVANSEHQVAVLEELQGLPGGHLQLGEEGCPAGERRHQPCHHLEDVEAPIRVLPPRLIRGKDPHDLGSELRPWYGREALELSLCGRFLRSLLSTPTEQWHRRGIYQKVVPGHQAAR